MGSLLFFVMCFGRVDHVDDIGTLHCIFDNGRTLGVIPGVDDFHVIREESEQTEEEENEYVNVTVSGFDR